MIGAGCVTLAAGLVGAFFRIWQDAAGRRTRAVSNQLSVRKDDDE
jgi:hypothetical protein